MRRQLSSTRPETAGRTTADAANPVQFRALATRKALVGTAAFAALAAAAGLGAAAPAMTAAADSSASATTTTAGGTDAATAKGAATAAAAGGFNLEDLMDRTVASGLGSAPTGGAWSPWGATFSVSGGQAHMANVASGVSARATLERLQVRDEGVSVTFSVPTLPTSGTGSFFGVLLRRQANGDAVYARVKVAPGGVATVSVKQQVGTTATSVGGDVTLPARLVAGQPYVLDSAITGGASASVAVRVYADRTATPGWQVSGTASLPTGMATQGSVGVYAYASGSGGAFSVDIDGIRGQDISTGGGTPTSTPTTTSPSSTPTTPSSSPSTSPSTSTSASSTPSSSPSSTPTTSTPPTPGTTTPGAPSVDGGIGFATNDPSTPPTTPVTTPPTTPVTTPPTSSTPPPPPVGKPGPDNTGPRPGVQLTVVTPAGGSLKPVAGQVLENLDIHGGVTVNVPNVVIRNCIIRGKAPSTTTFSPSPIVYAQFATNLQIFDTEIASPVVSINNQNSITGANFTLTRVNLHGGVDGMAITGSNVTVRDSWIHDTSYFAHSPFQNGGATHNDAIAVQGGKNILITGNTFERTTQSVIQTNPSAALPTLENMVITGNWIDGGSCSLNIAAQQFPTLLPITITGNRFGNHQSMAGCAIIANLSRTPLIMSGNVWDANDQPVTVTRGA